MENVANLVVVEDATNLLVENAYNLVIVEDAMILVAVKRC